jgi:hypothetical protein
MLQRDGVVMMVMKVLVMIAACGGVDVNHRPVGNPKRKV